VAPAAERDPRPRRQSKLDLDSRTLRRYLADLRDLGIEILDEGRGSERTLRLDPSYKRRGVELTLLEAVSMRFGRTLFNFLGGTQFAADMDDALERISPFIRRGDAERVRDLDKKIVAVPSTRRTTRTWATSSTTSSRRCSTRTPRPPRTRGRRGAEDGRAPPVHARHVPPGPLPVRARRRGGEGEDVRGRSLPRVRSAPERSLRGAQDYKPEDLTEDNFGIIGGPVHTVELRFDKKVAPYIRERIWHKSQRVHQDPTARSRSR
jgi:hypothetical protein